MALATIEMRQDKVEIGETNVEKRLGLLCSNLLLGVFAVAAPAIANGAKQFGETKSEHWGVITRNTIGSPVADLRAGPHGSFGVTGPTGDPPFW